MNFAEIPSSPPPDARQLVVSVPLPERLLILMEVMGLDAGAECARVASELLGAKAPSPYLASLN